MAAGGELPPRGHEERRHHVGEGMASVGAQDVRADQAKEAVFRGPGTPRYDRFPGDVSLRATGGGEYPAWPLVTVHVLVS
jgi:hypothetical protein